MKVGITGHQNIGSAADVEWVRRSLARVLGSPAVTRGLTSLAAGADQLFAQVLCELTKPYTAVVPSAGYETAFGSPEDRQAYERLLVRSDDRVTLPFARPSEEAFFAAGKKIVDRCDYMVAVWDGQPAKGLGGTADVVHYAQQQGKRVIHLNPAARTVSELIPSGAP